MKPPIIESWEDRYGKLPFKFGYEEEIGRIIKPFISHELQLAREEAFQEGINASIKADEILRQEGAREVLNRLKGCGHGGGSWRRLIEMELSRLEKMLNLENKK